MQTCNISAFILQLKRARFLVRFHLVCLSIFVIQLCISQLKSGCLLETTLDFNDIKMTE